MATAASEELVGEAIAGRRDQVFLVSKVYPHNASRRSMAKSCEASLRRLQVDMPRPVPAALARQRAAGETVEAFEALQRAGKIRHWGVSNFDRRHAGAVGRTPGGDAAQVNQVLYHLGERGIEWDLLPWLRERRVPVMAYSPFDEGRLLRHPKLVAFAAGTA
jgi:diketogulonate reductase-like aldo/keto reductase